MSTTAEHEASGELRPQWTVRRRRIALAAIVAVSVLVRVVYFVQLDAGPCVWLHRVVGTDMQYFDVWAQKVAAGDWLSRHVSPPLHGWHQAIAEAYLRRYPEEHAALVLAAEAEPPGSRVTPERLLQERWCGGGRFYQEPLYPYLLALTRMVFGPDVPWVFVWQMLLGVVSVVMVWAVARRCFGDLAGVIAGGLAGLCAPVLYLELVLVRCTLIVFMGLLLVHLADLATRKGRWGWWFVCGVTMGAAVLLKSHFVLFAVGVFVVLTVRNRRRPTVLARFLGATVAGMVIAVVPLAARNVTVGVPPMVTTAAGGLNFIIGNAADVDPSQVALASEHAPDILHQSGGRLLPTVLATLRTHEGPSSYLHMLWVKVRTVLHWYEIPGNTNFYYFRLHAPVLRALPVTLFVLAPLAVVGVVLSLSRRAACVHLYLLSGTHLAGLLVFLVSGRLRAPLVAALIPFAALTVVRLVDCMRRKELDRFALHLGMVLLVGLWTGRGVWHPLIRCADHANAYLAYYDPLQNEARQAGDWERVVRVLRESLRHEPAFLAALGHEHPARTPDEVQHAQLYARVHLHLARALENSGRAEEATRELLRAGDLRAAASMAPGQTP